MRIGLAVDGQAEVASFPSATAQLEALSGHILLSPVLVPMNADVPAAAIARECVARTGILRTKGIDLLVVLVDRVVIWADFRAKRQEERAVIYIAGGELANWLSSLPPKLAEPRVDELGGAIESLRSRTV